MGSGPYPTPNTCSCVFLLKATANPHGVFVELEKRTPFGNDPAPGQGTWSSSARSKTEFQPPLFTCTRPLGAGLAIHLALLRLFFLLSGPSKLWFEMGSDRTERLDHSSHHAICLLVLPLALNVIIIIITIFPGILMILQLLVTGAPLQLNLFGILPLKQPIFSLLDSFLLLTLLPLSSSHSEAHPFRKRVCGLASQPRHLGGLGRPERDRGAEALLISLGPALIQRGSVHDIHGHFQLDLLGYWNL